ncbi:hypothetical protein BDL97_10G005800 [Sphagnum fallax]|nr:hypothetical protein BDL97_10G005800 [Sphagnum fallax]
MVGETGWTVGVEHIPELVDHSIVAIKQTPAGSLLDNGHLNIYVADGKLGYAEGGPYDAIHVGAAAAELPDALVNQLKPNGRMVIPVGTSSQDLIIVDKLPFLDTIGTLIFHDSKPFQDLIIVDKLPFLDTTGTLIFHDSNHFRI